MSKTLRLTAHDVASLHAHGAGGSDGHLVHFMFVAADTNDTRTWSLRDVAEFLKSVPQATRPRALEITATATGISFGLWTPDKISSDQLENHFKAFNKSLKEYRPPTYFLPLAVGAAVRVGRVRLRRNPHHPIETRFGAGGTEGRQSPMVHLLNNLPQVPDGSALVVQILWRRHPYLWKMRPACHLDLRPYLGHDPEAIEEKNQARETYYVDVRLLEVHTDPAHANLRLVDNLGEAFAVWSRVNANSFAYDACSGFRWAGPWGRRRIVRFVAAIQDRAARPYPLGGTTKPHLSKDELAALVHPPPEGARVPKLLYAPVRPVTATHAQKAQHRSLQRLLEAHPNSQASSIGELPVHGKTRRLKANDVLAILHRSQIRFEEDAGAREEVDDEATEPP